MYIADISPTEGVLVMTITKLLVAPNIFIMERNDTMLQIPMTVRDTS